MSELVIIAYKDRDTAFAAREELLKLQKEYLIELEDAVVITHEAGGKVKLHQAANLTALGAVGGTFWGGLIGLLFLNPLLGAAAGAGAGALSGALTDIGINDPFLKEVGGTLAEGDAALAVMVRKATPDKVLERMSAFTQKGTVLRTTLTAETEAKLRQAFADGQGYKPNADGLLTPPPPPTA